MTRTQPLHALALAASLLVLPAAGGCVSPSGNFGQELGEAAANHTRGDLFKLPVALVVGGVDILLTPLTALIHAVSGDPCWSMPLSNMVVGDWLASEGPALGESRVDLAPIVAVEPAAE
jgi:hypothetical protein